MSRESDFRESYFIGAYWFDRPEERDACIRRTGAFLKDLARCHDTLGEWRWRDFWRGKGPEVQVDPDRGEEFARMFEYEGTDNPPPRPGEVLGYRFVVWYYPGDQLAIDLSITCGSNVGTNVAVISEPWGEGMPPVAPFFHDPAALEAVVETMVTHWQPECAAVTSHAYPDDVPDGAVYTLPRLPYVGWMTYLHADRVVQVPTALPPELADHVTARATPDGGRLFIVDTEHRIFTASNPEHVARTRALHGFLRDHGALEPTP